MNHYEREGGDITASDMILPEDDSDILEFYKNSTVFVTGATGFLGKLCVEKLLRTCSTVNKIYILMRPKKDKDVYKRFDELFDEPSFDPLKRKFPNFIQKIKPVIGDVSLPDLGLSDDDKQKLISEVDCVFHFAATVRFNESIRVATHINAVVHVSTAFSNCNRKVIDEAFYESPISGEKLITLVECLDDEKLEAITPTILGEFPNTYAFTKCVAEDIVRTEGKNLPVALYRPSIVIATVKEPVSGWIDNVYGATGILIGVAVGLLRTLHGRKENRAEMVPADYVINSCLAAAWDVASIKTLNDNKETQDNQSREEKFDKEIPVYNFVSTPQSPLTWDDFQKLSTKHCKQIPSEKCVWHSYFQMISNRFLHMVAVFLLHTIPAYIVDFIAVCIGKKPMLVKGYQKINKFTAVLSYFCMNQWDFKNGNVQALWKRMKKQDKELFEFSLDNFNWDMYFYTYTRGGRAYLLKDPLDTIPKGYVKYYKLMVAHYVLLAVLCYLLFKFWMLVLSCFFPSVF
ncbi:hypothetical protein NQ315_013596 [Exocentrus adspersus]|uniref:Fatty acyl-CoA reductase n=1 Tax=Exocentrus adspersus TaxID=1586481 RepID=A0AAV8W4V5_9CUCU|nr:hypothetical protein NQ315_013596 [Exocentrus adspersus]